MKINHKSYYELMDEELREGYTYILKVRNYDFKEVKIYYYNNQYIAEDELSVIGESENTLKDILNRFDVISAKKRI